MSFLAEYFLFKKAADHHRWGSAYPLHPSPRSAPDHNYFIEAPEREGNLGMSILQAVVDVGRDCRSNEIKPNRIKCRFLVGGENRQCWIFGRKTNRNPLMVSRSESNPDHIDKGVCSSQCNPGSHSFSSAIDQGLKREKYLKPDGCSLNYTNFSSAFNFPFPFSRRSQKHSLAAWSSKGNHST